MGYMTSQFRKVEPARLEQRGAFRHTVLLSKATVRRRAARPLTAMLLDVSAYGCRVRIEGSIKAGERLWLRLAGSEPISATAIWTEGDRIGCKFDEMLDRVLFRQLILQAS